MNAIVHSKKLTCVVGWAASVKPTTCAFSWDGPIKEKRWASSRLSGESGLATNGAGLIGRKPTFDYFLTQPDLNQGSSKPGLTTFQSGPFDEFRP